MERASLRPVPLRPSRPVEPDAALAHVESRLPDLDDAARQALALVDLVGRTRAQLRAETDVAPEELAQALARARKALRRAAFPLPGSGWCERAERLLSDELDGELEEPGPRRLAAHLANCDRCVEHERRLLQARDQLVASFEEARSPAAPVEPDVVERPDVEPIELPDPEPPAAEPPVEEPPVQPVAAAPAPELRLVKAAAEAPAAEAPAEVAEIPAPGVPEPRPAPPAPPQPPEPEPEPPAAAGEPEPEPEPEPPAAAGEPEPEPLAATGEPESESRLSLARVAWTASISLSVLLAVVSLALTVYAIAGGSI